MKTTLHLTIEDIVCSKMGNHINVTTKEGLVINLTPDAARELSNDINSIFKREDRLNEAKERLSIAQKEVDEEQEKLNNPKP